MLDRVFLDFLWISVHLERHKVPRRGGAFRVDGSESRKDASNGGHFAKDSSIGELIAKDHYGYRQADYALCFGFKMASIWRVYVYDARELEYHGFGLDSSTSVVGALEELK